MQIENILREVGIPFYSPRLNKSINDKKAVTVEDNNKLAEPQQVKSILMNRIKN